MKTVFWSWQSDRDERVTRNLIREALANAIKRLGDTTEIEGRPDEERIEIDHDTRGLPGSPDIVTSILAKIDAAAVFIGDVTPIAISDSGKHVANPNVLIELGYAKKALSLSRIITVWNTAFTDSRPENLPFDLRGRRGPVTYSLKAGATKTELGDARTSLTEQFVTRIGGCLECLPLEKPVWPVWQQAAESDPSLWIEPGQDMRVNEDFGSGIKRWEAGSRWYVRVLPSAFNPSEIDNGKEGPFVHGFGGYSWGKTTGGTLTYERSVRTDQDSTLIAASKWFRNTGEIWFAYTGISSQYHELPYFYGDDIAEQWAQMLFRSLKRLTESGGTAPFRVKLGVTGLTGLFWYVQSYYSSEPPAALEPAVEQEFEVSSYEPDAWSADFIEAWTEMRRAFSMPPPTDEKIREVIIKATR